MKEAQMDVPIGQSHESQDLKPSPKLDFFSVNALMILVSILLIGLYYFFSKTETGQWFLGLLQVDSIFPLALLALPFLGAPLSAYLGTKAEDYRDIVMVNVTFLSFLLILFYYPHVEQQRILVEMPRILGFGLHFRLDGLVWMLLLLAASIWLLAAIYAHHYMFEEEQHRNRFYFWMSITFGGVMGALMAEDLLTMFLFFEIIFISCYFLVAHNQSSNAMKAAGRYIYLGIVGGLTILFSMSILYYYVRTFEISQISAQFPEIFRNYPTGAWMSISLMLFGLGIKSAVFPLHFWLPDAHSSAPTPSSAVLSGIVLKVYLFSLLKILFRIIGPAVVTEAHLPQLLTSLAALGMIMGSVLAIGQKDIKKMLAYSSVAQVGYILLGIGLNNTEGFSAAMFHIVTHGLMKSALFFSSGAIIFQKGKRNIREFQGIGYEMPITLAVFSIGAFSMIGIPGLNGFMSKWYLSMAALAAEKPVFVVLIMVSSFLNALYYLPVIITAFLTEARERRNVLTMDQVPKTMLVPMIALAAGCVLFGIFPQWLMDFIEKALLIF